MSKILVTPLSAVPDVIRDYRPSHLVTLLSPEHMIETPKGFPRERHLRYDELGVYKYLLRVPPGERVRDRHADALRVLAEHDRRRNAQLLHTLEEFLRQRGHVGATAQALYVHPNTLRQRLRRIEELTGLDARDADWLLLEVALKLQRLEEVYPPGHHP